MELKTETTYVFEYRDLEELVKELYGMDIDILSDFIPFERLGHYTYHEWLVDGESELDTVGDDAVVAKWIETGNHRNLDMRDVPEVTWKNYADVELEHILHRLYVEKIIPAGNYLMKVDW